MSLSIYIPTFNRATKLSECLATLVPQVLQFPDVNIVISDNHSTDDTQSVIAAWKEKCSQIHHVRNSRNLGLIQNVLDAWKHVTNDYCWTVGDDELFAPNAVATLKHAIRENPKAGFFFYNSYSLLEEQRPSFRPALLDPQTVYDDSQNLFRAAKQNRSIRISSFARTRSLSFDRLIDPAVDSIYLGSLMVCAFKTELMAGSVLPEEVHETPFRDALNSYPHAVAFSRRMLGQQAVHIANPGTINFWGHRDWSGAIPSLLVCRLTELVETWIDAGLPRRQHHALRRHQIRRAATMVDKFFKPGVTGIDTFDPTYFESRYARTFPKEVKTIVKAWDDYRKSNR